MSRPPLLILRPAPGDAATAALAGADGWGVLSAPLFDIAPLGWDAPDVSAFDALLLTSANAVRHGGAALARYRALPVHAVGAATAEAAQAAGFAVASVGSGGAAAAHDAARAAGHARLLRLAGRDHVPLPDGVLTRIVYGARPRPLALDAIELLRDGPAIVLLHSAAAARAFVREVEQHTLPRARIGLAALAPAIADAAGDGWCARATASRPCDAALLSAAARLATQMTGTASRGGGQE